ncbi:MAG TPA: hypothetical protein VE196_10285 [Pseudonocardiaceae bacterium]|nr:hypothetical protein [Pseudonocardiaceae bacterium]
MTIERLWRGLDAFRADGLECVICGTSYLVAGSPPHVPVGRSMSGSRVFACVGECAMLAALDPE